jgi:hypothetical protein
MSDFADRMYPVGNVTLTLKLGDDEYPVEIRPPKWGEFIDAEARAGVVLKEALHYRVDEHGIPQPLPDNEKRMLSVQTGIELAKACVVKVGVEDTKVPGFWDRTPATETMALGAIMLQVVWDSGVGRKNSQSPAGKPETSGPVSKP